MCVWTGRELLGRVGKGEAGIGCRELRVQWGR